MEVESLENICPICKKPLDLKNEIRIMKSNELLCHTICVFQRSVLSLGIIYKILIYLEKGFSIKQLKPLILKLDEFELRESEPGDYEDDLSPERFAEFYKSLRDSCETHLQEIDSILLEFFEGVEK